MTIWEMSGKMALYSIGHNQIGASHIAHGNPNGNPICQDAYLIKWIKYGEVLSVAVADGHGSSACKYSHEGSRIATEVFCAQMEQLYQSKKDNLTELESFLFREGSEFVARRIVRDWQERIKEYHKEHHLNEGRVIPCIEKK